MLDPESVVRQPWEASNEGDDARVAGAISELCQCTSAPAEQTFVGPEAMVNGVRAFAATFSGDRTEIERLHVAGDVVVVERRTSVADAGGRRLTRRGCSVAEVRGAKIAALPDYFDRHGRLMPGR